MMQLLAPCLLTIRKSPSFQFLGAEPEELCLLSVWLSVERAVVIKQGEKHSEQLHSPKAPLPPPALAAAAEAASHDVDCSSFG
ncbi:hypothetical protein ACLOJK_000679 [Asimina triloba]